MFNYKSPLSRILEKPAAKSEAGSPAQAEADALNLQSLRDTLTTTSETSEAAEFHEDIDEAAPVAEQQTERSDFFVSQSDFDDDDLLDDEAAIADNIFVESPEVVDVPLAAAEAPGAENFASELRMTDVADEVVAAIDTTKSSVLTLVTEAPKVTLQDEPISTPHAPKEALEIVADTVVAAPHEDVEIGDVEVGNAEIERADDNQLSLNTPVEPQLETAPEPISEAVVEVATVPADAVETVPEPAQMDTDVAEEAAGLPVPTPQPRSRRRDRIKTTFLGLEPADNHLNDLISADPVKKSAVVNTFPVGWLVITDGPGRGTCLTLTEGLLQIGRNDDQALQLDFGDNGISRSSHAVVAYDPEERKCFLGHGGKANLVRLNGSPVLSTVPMQSGDKLRISETTMKFVSFCDQGFDWRDET